MLAGGAKVVGAGSDSRYLSAGAIKIRWMRR
jgi:hypothetical protein